MQSAQLFFSLPRGQGLHFAQAYLFLPWEYGLHSLHVLFTLPCEHRFTLIVRAPRHSAHALVRTPGRRGRCRSFYRSFFVFRPDREKYSCSMESSYAFLHSRHICMSSRLFTCGPKGSNGKLLVLTNLAFVLQPRPPPAYQPFYTREKARELSLEDSFLGPPPKTLQTTFTMAE